MTEKKLKVVFAEGCFDNFEGTPEELAELVAEIENMCESGELIENARPLSQAEEEELEHLMMVQALNNRRQ
jgi:hypothetical protein